MNKRAVGNAYEEAAVHYLEKNNIKILERNYRCRHGEIDIVALDGEYICFIEVKYRHSRLMGTPFEAVNALKQQRICMTARHFLYNRLGLLDVKCRYDVIGITDSEIKIIKNAFAGW